MRTTLTKEQVHHIVMKCVRALFSLKSKGKLKMEKDNSLELLLKTTRVDIKDGERILSMDSSQLSILDQCLLERMQEFTTRNHETILQDMLSIMSVCAIDYRNNREISPDRKREIIYNDEMDSLAKHITSCVNIFLEVTSTVALDIKQSVDSRVKEYMTKLRKEAKDSCPNCKDTEETENG